MSGISSIGSSTSSTYYSPLDTNKDGIVDQQELQAAAKTGLLSASVTNDESADSTDSSSSSATDTFSGNLIGMILQQMQQSASAGSPSSDASSSSTTDGASQSGVDALFTSLDTNGDGKVSADEFVAGRPKSISENEASALFKSLDQQNSGSLDQNQFAEGVNALTDPTVSTAASATNVASSATDDSQLQIFLQEMQASLTAYENTYGQYDFGTTAAGVVA